MKSRTSPETVSRAWDIAGKMVIALSLAAFSVGIATWLWSSMRGPEVVAYVSGFDFGNLPITADGDASSLAVWKSIHPPRQYFEVVVENEGSTQIDNISFEIPYEGVVSNPRPNSETSFLRFAGSIDLGALKPESSIQLSIWTTGIRHARFYDREFALKYKTGVGAVLVGTVTYGLWDAAKQYVPWLFLVMLGGIVWFAFSIWMLATPRADVLNRRIDSVLKGRKNNTNSDEELDCD
ncbi:MAG: hypothetical protein NXH85_13560 [Pseudomonadaceae bacterium]|nr:hypothetical protein [Pseudomonadaceae bacterium]